VTITPEQIATWLSIAGIVASGAWALGRVLIAQFTTLLDTRFEGQDEKFAALVRGQEAERGNWQRIERDLLELRAELPVAYVRREDYVRGQTVIEAKLDAIHVRVENVQIQVAQVQGNQK
jgi:hypothetical protein